MIATPHAIERTASTGSSARHFRCRSRGDTMDIQPPSCGWHQSFAIRRSSVHPLDQPHDFHGACAGFLRKLLLDRVLGRGATAFCPTAPEYNPRVFVPLLW